VAASTAEARVSTTACPRVRPRSGSRRRRGYPGPRLKNG
jgi:hypothetical protein